MNVFLYFLVRTLQLSEVGIRNDPVVDLSYPRTVLVSTVEDPKRSRFFPKGSSGLVLVDGCFESWFGVVSPNISPTHRKRTKPQLYLHPPRCASCPSSYACKHSSIRILFSAIATSAFQLQWAHNFE